MGAVVHDGRLGLRKLGQFFFVKVVRFSSQNKTQDPSFACLSFYTIWRPYKSKMSNALMQQFVAGLKSRNAETRSKAARDLYHYVSKK